jgi:hypothetical protein
MCESEPAASAEEPERVPQAEQSPPRREPLRLSSFTDADIRNLIVTIAGTVVGALLTALVLGLSISLAHMLNSPHPQPNWRHFWTVWSEAWVPATFWVFAAVTWFIGRPRPEVSYNGWHPVLLWSSVSCMTLLAVVLTLTLVGTAAGVR